MKMLLWECCRIDAKQPARDALKTSADDDPQVVEADAGQGFRKKDSAENRFRRTLARGPID
jgi:hypothetical protein